MQINTVLVTLVCALFTQWSHFSVNGKSISSEAGMEPDSSLPLAKILRSSDQLSNLANLDRNIRSNPQNISGNANNDKNVAVKKVAHKMRTTEGNKRDENVRGPKYNQGAAKKNVKNIKKNLQMSKPMKDQLESSFPFKNFASGNKNKKHNLVPMKMSASDEKLQIQSNEENILKDKNVSDIVDAAASLSVESAISAVQNEMVKKMPQDLPIKSSDQPSEEKEQFVKTTLLHVLNKLRETFSAASDYDGDINDALLYLVTKEMSFITTRAPPKLDNLAGFTTFSLETHIYNLILGIIEKRDWIYMDLNEEQKEKNEDIIQYSGEVRLLKKLFKSINKKFNKYLGNEPSENCDQIKSNPTAVLEKIKKKIKPSMIPFIKNTNVTQYQEMLPSDVKCLLNTDILADFIKAL